MPVSAKQGKDKADALAAYKGILRNVLDERPSGTRQRLATTLGKNRSFVTQIANAASPVPVPAQHLSEIFQVCHFSAAQRQAFLAAYHLAHPRRLMDAAPHPAMRDVTLHLPDLGDPRKNRRLQSLLTEMAKTIAHMLRGE